MKGIVRKTFPNIAYLQISTTKNSNVLHVTENNLIRLVFLQGTHTCDQNRHASSGNQIAKNINVMKLL